MELNGLQMEFEGLKIGVFEIQTTPNQLQTDFIGIIRVFWTPIWSFLEFSDCKLEILESEWL